MACPALPTCGLAVTESERSLPDINKRIRALMTKLGFDEGESLVVRMTGDPSTPLCKSPDAHMLPWLEWRHHLSDRPWS